MNKYLFVVALQVDQIFPTLVSNLCWGINVYIIYSDSVLEKTAIKDKIKYLTKPAHPVLRVPLSLELIRQEGFGPSP